jgi:hypothetical protein
MGLGAYARYTDDFLIFGDDKADLHELCEGIAARLAESRLEFAPNKTRVMATREGGALLWICRPARPTPARPRRDESEIRGATAAARESQRFPAARQGGPLLVWLQPGGKHDGAQARLGTSQARLDLRFQGSVSFRLGRVRHSLLRWSSVSSRFPRQ